MKQYDKDYILEESDDFIINGRRNTINGIEYRDYVTNGIIIFQANTEKNKIVISDHNTKIVHTIFEMINGKEEKVFSITTQKDTKFIIKKKPTSDEEITMLIEQIKKYRSELLKISPKNNSYDHIKNEISCMEKRIDEIRYLK